MKVYRNDDDAHKDIIKYIRSHPPEKVQAIQYSGIGISPIIRELLKTNCLTITLLLFDPRKIDDPFQRKRIRMSYEEKRKDFGYENKSERLKIFFYDTPSSLRGINFADNYVSVGWYVYFPSKESKTEVDILGHNQPLVNEITYLDNGKIFLEFFNKQFQRLSENKIESEVIEKWWEDNDPR